MLLLGMIGMGLVWGWLVGLWQPVRRIGLQILAVLLASGLLLLEIYLLAGPRVIIPALVSGLIAFFIHRLWRQSLRARRLLQS